MTWTDRRSFILRAVAVTSVLGLAHAPALADVDESDAVAVALGYKTDTKKVDSTKYPGHRRCRSCAATASSFRARRATAREAAPCSAGKPWRRPDGAALRVKKA